MARDRSQISFEQFAKPRAKRRRRVWRWLVPSVVVLGAAGAGGVYFARMAYANAPTHTPPALSQAGGPVAGEAYQWKHVAVGGGGFITGLAFDASGKTLVARTDVYGAYVWDAKADRWMQLISASTMPAEARVQDGMAEGAYEVAVAPSRGDRIFVAIKGRVYRSDDRGQSFVDASGGLPALSWDANGTFRFGGPFMAVDPANPDLVVLGTPQDGLWRSSNGGASWARVASVPGASGPAGDMPPGIKVWFEAPAGGKPTGRIFVLSPGHGMFVSADHGATFAPLPAIGDQPMNLRRGAFDRHGTFFGVDDFGQSIWSYQDGRWHNLSHEDNLPGKPWAAVAANPRADQVIVFDQGGAGYATGDGGRTWSSVTHSAAAGAGDPPWLRLANRAYFATADLAFDPAVPGRLWTAAGMGPFHADVSGGSAVIAWESQARGIEELVANDIVQAPGRAPVFGGWDFGLRAMSDLNVYPSTYQPGERELISVQQMDWSPADPDFLVTNASDARIGCCAEDGNAVMAGTSHDDGQSWSKFASLPTPGGTRGDDPWRMSFGTIAVAADNTKNIVWEPAFNRQPFYTQDGGRSWLPVDLPGAVGDTTGSFAHQWYQRKTLAADKAAGGTFYLVHTGESPNQALAGLWRSRDGGQHWERVYGGLIAPGSGMAAKLRAVPGHAGQLFFTAGNAGEADSALRRSRDGGATWQVLPRVTRVDDIAFGKAAKGAGWPAIYVSGRVDGRYGVWRSVDNAASWQLLTAFPAGTLDQVTVLAADPDVFGRVYLGYKGSGWIWGEPAPCAPAAAQGLVAQTCSRVGG